MSVVWHASTRKAYIVINENEIIPDVERCLEEIHKHPELEMQLISPERAIELKRRGPPRDGGLP